MNNIQNTALIFSYCIIVIVLITGCKGSKGDIGLTGPEGPSGPLLTGKLHGFVELYAEDNSLNANHSDVSVSIEGSNIITTTDPNGKWVVENLSTGTYTIVFAKPNYGTFKKIGVQFLGGGEGFLDKTILVHKPTIQVTSISVEISSDFYVSGRINSPAGSDNGNMILLFMDTTSSVSSNPKDYLFFTSGYASPSSTLYESRISLSQLRQIVSVASGKLIYVAAYTASSGYYNSIYPDTATGRNIYTAISDSSKKTSFIMP